MLYSLSPGRSNYQELGPGKASDQWKYGNRPTLPLFGKDGVGFYGLRLRVVKH